MDNIVYYKVTEMLEVSWLGTKLIQIFKGATVKPPNKGHIGDRLVVPCREVVLFSEVFF